MNNNLKAALHYLGKYVNEHEDVKKMDDGEWMTFSVTVRKLSPGIIQFTKPCLTAGAVHINEEENVVILNEFHYPGT